MSDRQSKNYDGAFTYVAGRTRSKTDDVCPSRNLGATNASHEPGGTSASIARRNPAKTAGKSPRYSSSCNDTDDTGFEEVAAHSHGFIREKKRKRNQLKPKRPVGRPRKNFGKDMEECAFRTIDEAEFKRIKACSLSKRGKSLREEASEGSSAANSWKNAKGNSNDDEDSEGMGFKVIEEAEFLNLRENLTSKIGFKSNEDLPEGHFDVNPRKDVRKKASSADYSGSFCPEDTCNGSNNAWLHESSSFVPRGSNSEDMAPEEIEMVEIDEAEFRKRLRRSESKIGRSVEQGLCAASASKNIHGAGKHKSLADHSKPFSPGDHCTGPDVFIVDSSPSPKKGKKAGLASYRESIYKQIDEAEFLKGKSRSTSKIGSSTRQGYSAAKSRKSGDIVKEPLLDNYCSFSSSADPGRDSDKEQTDRSSSFAEKGNNDEDTDLEELGFHMNDESEFRKLVSKIGSSTRQDGVHFTSLPDDETSSYGATHDTNHGVATRTRSKMGSSKKPAEVGDFSLDISDDSDFSSSFEGGSSDSFDGTEELCSYVEACDEQNVPMKVSAKKSTDKAEEGFKERSNCPKCTCSKQLSAPNDSDEAKRFDGLHPKDQTEAGIRRQKKEASSSHSKDKDDDIPEDDVDKVDDIPEKLEATSSDVHGHDKIGTTPATDEIKERRGMNHVPSKGYDFCSMLADAVLGYGPKLPEAMGSDKEAMQTPASQTQNTLPMKFRFEDEVPKDVEKTAHEKEMDDLFNELDVSWQLEELGSFVYTKIDQKLENPPAEETQHARCARGKHELRIEDDKGLVCIFCHHEELGPKDILPDWVDKSYQESGRKRHCEAEQPFEFDELNLESSINNVAEFGSGTVWSLKPDIWKSMFEHQREGFEFLWQNLAGSINLDEVKRTDSAGVGGCIISHAPGSGKTRLTINFLETYLKVFPNSMPVIISPASMLLTWEEEFKKWDVGFPFLNLNNSESFCQEKKAALGLLAGINRRNSKAMRMVTICTWSMGGSVLGISYSLFEKLTGEKYMNPKAIQKRKVLDDQTEKVRKILLEKPGLVFLDEGHTPRNQRSNIWNALLKLQTEKRVILSGTPFQNNFTELFNTLQLVRPAIAKEKMFAEMKATRRVSKHKGEHSQSPLVPQVNDQALEKLKISMAPFVHIHKGDILQRKVPGLRDCVILLKPSALQKTLIERLEGSSTFEFEHRVALISVHPYLLQHTDPTEEQKSGIDMAALEASKLNPNDGVKTKFILELVRLSVVLKEKVLIFSQYLQPLELIKEQLKEAFKWGDGKEILQMQGRLEQKHRQVLINSFNDPKSESKVMLASTKCCSEGISLIGASRLVLLDVVWNPSVERQAICRAYRVGQQKYVYTYHLMTSGTTEADKYCRQADKERLSELVFSSSSNEGNKQKHPSLGIEDRVLEEMVGHDKLKEMFEKIINQPKDKDLIQTFGLTS